MLFDALESSYEQEILGHESAPWKVDLHKRNGHRISCGGHAIWFFPDHIFVSMGHSIWGFMCTQDDQVWSECQHVVFEVVDNGYEHFGLSTFAYAVHGIVPKCFASTLFTHVWALRIIALVLHDHHPEPPKVSAHREAGMPLLLPRKNNDAIGAGAPLRKLSVSVPSLRL
jgi:hypothetical protein